jgi:monoterpene epsilon-lactone hydrolase
LSEIPAFAGMSGNKPGDSMTEEPKFTPLHLDARSVPVPKSISREARTFLGKGAETPIISRDYPALEDTEGWLRWIEATDANMQEMMAAAGGPPVEADLETLTIGAAPCYRAGAGCSAGAQLAAVLMGATVYAPDYRMPPHHPYPVPLDDCVAAYREVLKRHAPERIVVHGMSAGGNLAAALMLRVAAEGLPLPAGLVLETPELDLTESGDSFQTNRNIDVVLQDSLDSMNRLYAGGHDLADPYLSPLFGDFSRGYPPTLITAGTRDLFLSNAARMLHRLRRAKVPVELLVYEAMPHAGFFGAPEDVALKQDIRQFAERCWAGR